MAVAGLRAGAQGLTIGAADGRGCTSLFLSTADGTRLYATNLDYFLSEGRIYVNKRGVAKRGWEAGASGTYAEWTSSHGSVTFNLAGYQLVWAGMNEAGLSLSTMALDQSRVSPPDAVPPLEGSMFLQYLLDTSSSVAQALENARKVRVGPAVDHYMLADASGAAAVIEFLDGKMVVHAGKDLPVAALTNTTYKESVEAWRSSRAPVYSLTRFIIAADGVAAFGRAPAANPTDYAFGVLAKARQPMTVWTIAFDARSRLISFFTASGPKVRSIDMKRLDFSGSSPVLMMDVNAKLSGDVTGRLVPYSHQDALTHMAGAFTKFAPAMSRQDVDSFLSFLEFKGAEQKGP